MSLSIKTDFSLLAWTAPLGSEQSSLNSKTTSINWRHQIETVWKPFVFIVLLPDMTLGLVSLLAPRRNAILWHNLISLGSAARLCHKCGHSGMTQTLGPAAWLHVMQISDVLCKWPDSRVTDPSLRLLWSEFVNIFLADSQGPWAEKLWHDHSEWIKIGAITITPMTVQLVTGNWYQSYGSDHYLRRYCLSSLAPLK